jgi:tRNA/rRNA methyltransferase
MLYPKIVKNELVVYIYAIMKICFILVRPAVPGNIGASARAMKTMGFSCMRLVNPCDHLSREARILAHASGEILDNAEIFNSLEGALSNIDLSIATTAGSRVAKGTYRPVAGLPGIIQSKGKTVERIAIVFGSEGSGLTNEEIRRCDIASSVPLKQSYPSLNLSQAVMIYAYTLAELSAELHFPETNKAGGKEFRTMMDRSRELLLRLEVDRSPALFNRILERIALLEEEDVHLLLSILGRLG